MITACAVAWGTCVVHRNKTREAQSLRVLRCRDQLQDVASATETFQSRRGRLPSNLEELNRLGVLRDLPTCPASGRTTYRIVTNLRRPTPTYTILCSGDSHSELGLPPDYPQYSSLEHEVLYHPGE